MRVYTNKTAEGEQLAVKWTKKNLQLIPKIRRIFIRFFEEAGREFPWRKTKNPYEVLIAEFLLQKTNSMQVIGPWENFIKVYPDVLSLSKARLYKIESIVKPLGLHKRAKIMIKAAIKIQKENGGEIPKDLESLKKNTGIGNYTAAAVLSFGYGIKSVTVDTNAARVYSRICGFEAKTLRQKLSFASTVAERVVSAASHRKINLGAIDFAAQICRPNPACPICPANKICSSILIKANPRPKQIPTVYATSTHKKMAYARIDISA